MSKEIIFNKVNNIGWITLNRPNKHNAISHNMVVRLYEQIIAWELDSDVFFLVIEGAGEKAFSAGGDVRKLYDMKDSSDIFDFVLHSFSKEYTMDMKLHNYKKPIVTYMNGITMGGGVGIGVTGSHRIVNENTKWAMPEVDIGLFPDVGASYFMNKAPDNVGKYLALTGRLIKGTDVIACNLADFYIKSDNWPYIKIEFLSKNWKNEDCGDMINYIINRFQNKKVPKSYILENMDKINEHFCYDTMEEILESLFNSGNWGEMWAKDHLKKLLSKSPTSLKVILKQISDGKKLSMEECFNMELILAVNFMKSKDFFEGVRAVLVDKDRKPKWCPSTINSVDMDTVGSYFTYTRGERDMLLI